MEIFLFRARSIPAITESAGNQGNDGKFHKRDQTLNQTKRNINKLCLKKISLQKRVRIKFSVDSEFSNVLYGKKRKPGNAGNQQKAFYIKKHPVLTITITRKLLKSNQLLSTYHFGFNNKKSYFQTSMLGK